MAKATPQRRVQCYHCRHRFDISSRAMSVPCPRCAKALIVEDVVINTAHNVRKIQTCGKVVIEKKGRVVAQSIEAHEGVFVEGIVEAKVLSGGPVKIGPKAQWKGDCSAPTLNAELGCRIDRGFFNIPDDPLGVSDLKQHTQEPTAHQPKSVQHRADPSPAPHKADPSPHKTDPSIHKTDPSPHKADPSPAPTAPPPKSPARKGPEPPQPEGLDRK